MHPGKSLTGYVRYLKRFGILEGSKNFYSNYFAKKDLLSVKVPGLEHEVYLRNQTSDVDCFDQVFLEKDYDFDIDFKPELIIDCGANIGLSSLFFRAKYPEAHIIAVEPEQSNFEMLQRNTKPYNNIECLNCGIWNRNVNLKITEESKAKDKWGFIVTETEEQGNGAIKAITISEIMRKYGKSEIGILKMDIEGSELEVFSSNYEEWLPKTKTIMMELHDWRRKGCSRAFFEAIFRYDFWLNQYFKREIVMCRRN